MAVPPISFPLAPVTGVQPVTGPSATVAAATPGVTGVQGANGGFGDILASSVDQLQAVQTKSDTLGIQAASGDLKDAHDYMIASTEAALATDMVVAVRNKGVEAFNEIMRMPV